MAELGRAANHQTSANSRRELRHRYARRPDRSVGTCIIIIIGALAGWSPE
jgi:hypothetical protein